MPIEDDERAKYMPSPEEIEEHKRRFREERMRKLAQSNGAKTPPSKLVGQTTRQFRSSKMKED